MRLSGPVFVIMAVAMVVGVSASTASAQGLAAISGGGTAGDGQTSIVYNPATGAFGVSAPEGVGLTSINIESAGAIFTGGPAENLSGDFDIFKQDTIFKATFGSDFGTLSFGQVATTGLTEAFLLDDLTVDGSLATGGGLGNVDLIYVPEPSSCVLLGLGLMSLIGLAWRRNRTA